MSKNIVLLFGNGHLSFRLKKMLVHEGYQVLHTTLEKIQSLSESDSLFDNLKIYLQNISIENSAMVYLIDEKDEINLQLLISLISSLYDIPITVSLFNENLIPHLKASKHNVTILNPAKLAAPSFVNALYKDVSSFNNTPNILDYKKVVIKKNDSLITKLLFSFLVLIILSIMYFHFFEKMSWINSAYFVVVTTTTVGYGDFNLMNSSNLSKVVGMFLMIFSTVFIWMIFSLVIDNFFKARLQLALGRKKYNLKNHVVVCGLGRLGFFIVEELINKKEKVIIIEQSEDTKYIDYLRKIGINVYIGDAKMQQVLLQVNVKKAKALISVVNNDSINIEIGLNARSLKADLKLILRVFDEKMAKNLNEYLNINLTLSASEIADNIFFDEIKKQKATVTI